MAGPLPHRVANPRTSSRYREDRPEAEVTAPRAPMAAVTTTAPPTASPYGMRRKFPVTLSPSRVYEPARSGPVRKAGAAHHPLWRRRRGARSSSGSGKCNFPGAVGVAGVRGAGDAVPGQGLSQRVLERRRLKAEVAARLADVVTRVAPRVGAGRACSVRKLGERERVHPRVHAHRPREALHY